MEPKEEKGQEKIRSRLQTANLYHFKLNNQRNGLLVINESIYDNIVYNLLQSEVSSMYRKKVITTSLAIIAIVTAVSLIAAPSSGIVTSAFALKRGSDSTVTSSNKKDTSTTGGSSSTSSGSKSDFIKCVRAISGSLSKTEVDDCWHKVFGSDGGSSSGGGSSSLTLGPSTNRGDGSSSLSRGSSGRGDTSTEG